MSRRSFLPLAIVVLIAAALVAIIPAAGSAKGKVETIRMFSRSTSLKVLHPDGSATTRPPFTDPKAGDTLIVKSLGYEGDHKHHAKRPNSSTVLTCKFGAGEPDCTSYVAIGGSLLVFGGNPGTLIDGAGKYDGATGKVVVNKEVSDDGDVDIVAKIRPKN
jgi:hypothetical protein